MSLRNRRGGAVQRCIDLCVAAVVLVVFAPVLLIVGALVAARLGRPVLFRQSRLGLNGEPFTLIKFRTMLDVDDRRGRVTDADRLTPLGRVLREASLDELPTMWNVLRGEMSLVGPRPLLTCYVDRYTPEQARRHLVRPGVTGLAQVRGRNSLTWEEKFALDVWYVDHQSLRLNLRICAKTVLMVLRRQGIAATGNATMPEFTAENVSPPANPGAAPRPADGK